MTARLLSLLRFGRSRRTVRREVRPPFARLTLRRFAAPPPAMLVRNSPSTVTQRVQLVVAPRFDLRTARVSVHAATPAATAVELRTRESLVLREHIDKAIERVTLLTRHAGAAAGAVPGPIAAAHTAPATRVHAARAPAAPIVLHAPAPAPSQAPTASPAATARGAADSAHAPFDVTVVADEVMRTLDRRVAAERERRGRV
jgi:hypothetical protein